MVQTQSQVTSPSEARGEPSRRQVLYRAAAAFQERSIDLAMGGATSHEEWEAVRADLLSQPELLAVLPRWIAGNRWGGQFWQFIKGVDDTYKGRREFLWRELSPVFDLIEKGDTQPTALSLVPYIERGTSAGIADAWARIQARREADPEGAITLARTLLEGTCKELLHKLNVAFDDGEDLPKLYARVAGAMNLGPEAHKEQLFKQVLGGCMTVANGLAAIRNAFGDAHGKSPTAPRPSARHADLAINLAGSVATFLMATYEERYEPPRHA